MLKIVAQRLQAIAGATDIVIRSGGDEFVIVAPQLEDMLAIRALASRVLAALREPMVLDNVTLATTASIGVAQFSTSSTRGGCRSR